MVASNGRDLIVVGASRGGIEAVRTLLAELPPTLPAAMLIVQHISGRSPSRLDDVFARWSNMPVSFASDGAPLEHGHIYVAPPNLHLLVVDRHLELKTGPHENRWRPSIDVLFRSAAVAYGNRAIGLVLTGLLDDGTAGLSAIDRCGGITLVQDPQDAEFPDMPENALANLKVNFCLPLSHVATTLQRLVSEPVGPGREVPEDLRREVSILIGNGQSQEQARILGKLTPLVCPDCGGSLYQVHDDKLERFRCHVGHAYSARSLVDDQDQTVERAMWAAVRVLEDRASLMQRLARTYRNSGHPQLSEHYEGRARESTDHAQRLRAFLLTPDSPLRLLGHATPAEESQPSPPLHDA